MNIQQYKKRLLEFEKALSARTDRAMEDGRRQIIDTAHDTGDASMAAVIADDAFTEAELDSTVLNQVREALARIEAGTYGKCLADGGPIETKRLDALPWAAYCVKHQGLIEAASRQRDWTL
ncbi:MAG: TraR/DksA C4-type zinc finger protein [Acidobacteriota bacterium]